MEKNVLNRFKFLIACNQLLKDISFKDFSLAFFNAMKNDILEDGQTQEQKILSYSIDAEISDEYCWKLISSLKEREAIEIVALFIEENEFCNLKAALKNSDSNLFFDCFEADALPYLKIVIKLWELKIYTATATIEYFENIISHKNNKQLQGSPLSKGKKFLNDVRDEIPYSIVSSPDVLNSYVTQINQVTPIIQSGCSIEYCETVFRDQMFLFFDRLNCPYTSYITKEALHSLFVESEYSMQIQKFYNQYKNENPEATDWVISVKYHEKLPDRSLPENFDEIKDISHKKDNLHLKLRKNQIEYLFMSLLNERYIAKTVDIKSFASFLTGKPEKFNKSEKIVWQKELQALACLIGLLIPKIEGGKDGKWARAEEAFIFNNKDITTNGLRASFERLDDKYKEKKKYKNETYDYLKKLIADMNKIS